MSYPPPYRPPYPGPPTPIAPPPAPPPDIDTARLLWRLTAVPGLAAGVCSLFGVDRRAFARQMYDEYRRSDPHTTLTMSQLDGYVWAVLGITAALVVALWAVVVIVAERMYRGRGWARNVLTVIGGFEVLSGVVTLIGASTLHGTLAMVGGALSVLAAVCAGGAVVMMFRPDAKRFFVENASRRR
jgi:hypothetical protein